MALQQVHQALTKLRTAAESQQPDLKQGLQALLLQTRSLNLQQELQALLGDVAQLKVRSADLTLLLATVSLLTLRSKSTAF